LLDYIITNDFRENLNLPIADGHVILRGFRQVSRGSDSGAFHHPLFRRDKPDLCKNMACQRSRDRKDSKSCQNLPLRKRAVNALTSRNEGNLNYQITSQVAVHNSHLPSEPSSLFNTELSQTRGRQHRPLHSKCVNPTLVLQRALRQSHEQARIQVAKAMLYDSFIKALKE